MEALAEQGCVALLFANTPAAMAPWAAAGGVRHHPLAFACPLPGRAADRGRPALSKVARAATSSGRPKRGEPIPEGWALDADGPPDHRRRAAALDGTMVPLGDAKGTALALMVELLAAGLVGARFAGEASSFLDAAGDPPGTGQLILALDATALSPDAPERFAGLAEAIELQDGARLPGAAGWPCAAGAAEAGLDLADARVAEIRAL